MNTHQYRWPNRLLILILTLAVCWILTACSSDGGNSTGGVAGSSAPLTRTFRITVTNITHNQPISPAAVVMHSAGYVAWRIGEPVSVPFELLAEEGDPSDLISTAKGHPNVLATAVGNGVILPGATETVDIRVTSTGPIHLSIASMLVNTNDAFTGIDEASLDGMDIGQSASFMLSAYDAGTELNSEEATHVPGPAAGGEGFNATRDDSDHVRIHPGVVSAQDGLGSSTLDGSHRWDNPVAKLTIARTG